MSSFLLLLSFFLWSLLFIDQNARWLLSSDIWWRCDNGAPLRSTLQDIQTLWGGKREFRVSFLGLLLIGQRSEVKLSVDPVMVTTVFAKMTEPNPGSCAAYQRWLYCRSENSSLFSPPSSFSQCGYKSNFSNILAAYQVAYLCKSACARRRTSVLDRGLSCSTTVGGDIFPCSMLAAVEAGEKLCVPRVGLFSSNVFFSFFFFACQAWILFNFLGLRWLCVPLWVQRCWHVLLGIIWLPHIWSVWEKSSLSLSSFVFHAEDLTWELIANLCVGLCPCWWLWEQLFFYFHFSCLGIQNKRSVVGRQAGRPAARELHCLADTAGGCCLFLHSLSGLSPSRPTKHKHTNRAETDRQTRTHFTNAGQVWIRLFPLCKTRQRIRYLGSSLSKQCAGTGWVGGLENPRAALGFSFAVTDSFSIMTTL